LLWLGEGDANLKYFHAIMSSRHHINDISSILVDGNRAEGVDNVRATVFFHFTNYFQAQNVSRPRVENLQFRRLSHVDGVMLMVPYVWRR